MDSNTEKGISIIIFFLITIVGGLIPILLFSRCRGRINSVRGQAVLSHLNCFAGGVFLATCLLNLLVEGFEEYENYKEEASFDNDYPFFHLGIGAGFFLVAFVERVAALLSKQNAVVDKTDDGVEDGRMDHFGDSRRVVSEPSSEDGTAVKASTEKQQSSGSAVSVLGSDKLNSPSVLNGDLKNRNAANSEKGERFSGQIGVRAITLLLALSFHTIFDGLAVGLQETEADIWTTTAAISIHKTIVAVSLGLELAANMRDRPVKAFLFLFLFALVAPIGVAIGMGVTSSHVDVRAHMLTGSVLQAVATGSFLYVTFFEVLGEELGHDSSVTKIVATLIGFGAMAVAKIWDSD